MSWLSNEMKSNPEYVPSFLELLTVLPQVERLVNNEMHVVFTGLYRLFHFHVLVLDCIDTTETCNLKNYY